MFRDAFAHRRALIPAQAFYEWQRTENAPKQPYAIARRDGETLAFAGLWEGWRSPEGEVLRSFAIIVTAANATMAQIHDRMPVIVERPDWPLWLGETEGDAASLLHPAAEDTLRVWPVSTRVNRTANNDADLLAPLPTA
jgi:putative SOS response-associated peptidase YedK